MFQESTPSKTIPITYQEKTFEAFEEETVLECLIRNQIKIPHSCQSGICQSCMLKIQKGQPSEIAQKGLDQDQKEQGLIYSCQQKVHENLHLVPIHEGYGQEEGKIIERIFLSESVAEISFQVSPAFTWKAGQFINLIRDDGLTRSYSAANPPQENLIKIQVRRISGGQMSSWLCDQPLELLKKEKLMVQGPVGKCYYRETYRSMDLILAGTGTGLAPLYGVLLTALQQKHLGKIHLLHGGLNPQGLYLEEELCRLEKEFPQFTYSPCVLDPTRPPHSAPHDSKESPKQLWVGDLREKIKSLSVDAKNTAAFFCGDPQIVNKMKQLIFLKGVSPQLIFSDPFIASRPSV